MYKKEYIDILMAVSMRILETEFEVRHVDWPRPILSDDEPREKEEIENCIGETRTI